MAVHFCIIQLSDFILSREWVSEAFIQNLNMRRLYVATQLFEDVWSTAAVYLRMFISGIVSSSLSVLNVVLLYYLLSRKTQQRNLHLHLFSLSLYFVSRFKHLAHLSRHLNVSLQTQT